MTDNEIIKALECCKMPVGSGACNNCPLKGIRDKAQIGSKSCTTILIENVIDLINRQKAEIERLQETICMLTKTGRFYGTVRAEAIKEFAEMVKTEQSVLFNVIYSSFGFAEAIDNLVKEMVGDV